MFFGIYSHKSYILIPLTEIAQLACLFWFSFIDFAEITLCLLCEAVRFCVVLPLEAIFACLSEGMCTWIVECSFSYCAKCLE